MLVTLIGAGRIGTALADRARAVGRDLHLIDRRDGWDALEHGAGAPILVAVRNDDLDAVVARVPVARLADLVFLQNGMLRGWLADHALAGATRGLLFLAVARRGDPPIPGGKSPFHGRHAAACVALFTDLELPAIEVDAATFATIELEKLIWNSAFGLLSQVYSATVGEVCEDHRGELRDLTAELATIGGAELDVDLAIDPLIARLCAYSATIADYRGAVREWPWRNGWFVARARARAIPTPTHVRLLAVAGAPPT